MKTKYSSLVICAIMFLLGTNLVAVEKVLYADDFNRLNNKWMGYTSVGNYTWDDTAYHSFSVSSSNMYVVYNDGSSEQNAHAHVRYDLDSQEAYSVKFDVTMINSPESGSYSGLFLLPRTSQSTNVVENKGWIVNCNYYLPNGSGAWTRFYWYDGSETNAWGSIPATRLDTNQFNRIDIQSVAISVKGDYASLLVTQSDGATLVDKKRYIGNYNTGEESVFLFAKRANIDRTTSGNNKPWSKHNVDNLVVESISYGTVINIK